MKKFLLFTLNFVFATVAASPMLQVPILIPPSDDSKTGEVIGDLDTIVVEPDETTTLLPETNESGSKQEFNSSHCFLDKSKGTCRAVIEQFYFNTATKTCQIFAWSGCGGNENRFSTKEICETHCSQPEAGVTNENVLLKSEEVNKNVVEEEKGVDIMTTVPSVTTTTTTTTTASTTATTTTSTSTSTTSDLSEPKNVVESTTETATTILAPTNKSTTTPSAGGTSINPPTGNKHKLPICPKFSGCGEKCVVIQDRSDRGCRKCLCGGPTETRSNEEDTVPGAIIVSSDMNVTITKTSEVSIGSVSGVPEDSAKDESPIEGDPAENCALPTQRGHCRGMLSRYRYEPALKDCVEFHYGGCDGNLNNFVTKAKCLEYCKGQ